MRSTAYQLAEVMENDEHAPSFHRLGVFFRALRDEQIQGAAPP